MGSKKTNPRKIPISEADLKKAVAEAKELADQQALLFYAAVFLTILLDKYNGGDYIKMVWDDVLKLTEEVSEGRVSLVDLLTVLRDEYGINPVHDKVNKNRRH